jgi:hypothetical protein
MGDLSMTVQIPGVTYHPRSTWEDPSLPVNQPGVYTPPAHDLDLVDTIVSHYTADDDLIDGDPGEHAEDLPGYLRAIQRDYRNRHSFSIGYSWAVDWLGGVWELRGWEYRPAATGGKKVGGGVNQRSFAVLCLVDGNDPLTVPYAVGAFRRIVAEVEARCARSVHIGSHDEYDWTGCTGDGIRAQIAAGLLRPPTTDPEEPPMTTFYFTIAKPAGPGVPIWYSTDGLTAYRLTPTQARARGNPAAITIPLAEAAKFAYVNTLEFVPAV